MRIPRSVVATTAVGAIVAGGAAAVSTAASAGAASVTGAVAMTATADVSPARAAHGVRSWWKDLTDEQRGCLKDADLSRPVGPLSLEQRRALQADVTAAAKACNVELPRLGPLAAFWNGLTPEQIGCIQDTGVSRPLGRLTQAERQDLLSRLSAAAEKCGVTMPDLPSGGRTATPSAYRPA